MFRYSFLCLAATLLFSKSVVADGQRAATPEEQLTSRIAVVFDAAGMSAARPLPWVVVEYGLTDSNLSVQGWLIRDEPDRVVLFDCFGAFEVFRRPGAQEIRPKTVRVRSLGPSSVYLPESQVAWVVRSGDFDKYCKTILERSIPDPRKMGPIVPVHYVASVELEETLVSGCLLSREAKRRGNAVLGRILLTRSVQAFHRMPLQPLESKRDLEECFLDICAERMANSAKARARYGAPRPDLLLMWEIIARLPAASLTDQAKDLVAGYKSLVEEDRAWNEPKWLASLTTDQKVAYWMYRLRDLDDSMYSDAGLFSSGRMNPRRILNDFQLPKPFGTKSNPAMELKNLGKAALPAVIAHLDDTRPTRTGSLLRYGDCCQQIFEAITGFTIFKVVAGDDYPVQLGQQKLCKQRAENWWAEQQLKK